MGGEKNIVNYTHCATRLRFQLKDKTIVEEELKTMPEILGVMDKGGQYQLIIGPNVDQIYQEICVLNPIMEKKEEAVVTDSSKQKPLDVVLSFISGSISPALPVMVASGLINAVLALLVQFAGLPKTSGTYVTLAAVADTVFYYLPVLIAFAGAKRLKTNEYLAAFLALVMIHPAINNIEGLSLFGFDIEQVKYSANIIPALMMVPVLAFFDKKISKIIPEAMTFILKPFILTMVIVPLSLFILGPLGAYVGKLLADLCVMLSNYGAISIGLMSLLQPVLVLTGMHTVLIPLIVNEIATYGFSYIFTKALAANFAIAGAAIAVGLKAKNKKNKQIGFTTGTTALLSVTEPAIYGCLIRFKKPFVTAMIASGICGTIIGALKIHSYATAPVSLLTMPIFMGSDLTNFVLACGMAVVTFTVSLVITYIVGIDED